MRFLVTAGPTHEPIDAVRFIGNRSSGRMGIAIARAALAAGHDVGLCLGPVCEPPPQGATTERFRTAEDLRGMLARLAPRFDIIVMAAAVADFRPASASPDQKIERGESLQITLVPTPDLIAELAANRRPGQLIVGFALEESARLEERSRAKLLRKGLDAIVANPLLTMDAATIDGQLIIADGRVLRPSASRSIDKSEFAAWLVTQLIELHATNRSR
ncbi:MAG: phosphopantothenoylcysteine decarboxylase [Phycisphaerae bacterium]|mgnify:CR=1 FL=1|nr:phosphopantothenoylcysteine decarboxylase [Phycisphaerae bacterium]